MQGRINRQCLSLQCVAVMVALLSATLCFAQTADKAAESYVGEIVAANGTDIYAGGGKQFYTVGKVEAGQRVVVRGELFQWYRIVPPAGVYSYVTKSLVDATGDGRRGVVNRPRAEVTSASIDGPGVSYSRQAFLDKGDIVTIVAEEGSFYKIEPPADAIVWLPPNSVRKVEGVSVDSILKPTADTKKPPVETAKPPVAEAPVETVSAPPPPAVNDVVEAPAPGDGEPMAPVSEAGTTTPDVTDEGVEMVDETVTTPAGSNTAISTAESTPPAVEQGPPSVYAISVKAESPAVQALEAQLLDAGRKPLEEQPLEQLLAGYADVLQKGGLSVLDQRLVGARIEQMTRQAEVAKLLKSLKQTQETVATSTVAVVEPPKPRPRTAYDAVGQLLASGVFDGQSAPLLFRVVEPANLRTIAYIRPGKNFDTQGSLGRIVGVIGNTQYDPTLKLRVLDVEEIDVLEQ
jgi:uncharacterized protein YgiM (DUF1202 family)